MESVLLDKLSILVLGASGFLGGNISQRFPNAVAYSRKKQNYQNIEDEIMGSKDSILETLDQVGPQIVINCIAMANIDSCEANPQLAYWTNAELPLILAKESNARGFKLVHFSTDAVFSDEDLDRKETDFTNPVSEYARTKLLGEKLVLQENPESLVLRTNFFGSDPKNLNILSFFARKIFSDQSVDGFMDAFFTPLYVEDVVRITGELLKLNQHGLFHVTGDTKLSKADFGVRVALALNKQPSLVNFVSASSSSKWKIRTNDLTLNNEKMKNLGIVPQNIELGIEKAVKMWKIRNGIQK